MKIVCAWCKAHLGEKPGPDEITHTICIECMDEHIPAPSEDLSLTIYARLNITGRDASHNLNQILAGYYGAIDCYGRASDKESRYHWRKVFNECSDKLSKLVQEHKLNRVGTTQ